MERPEPQTYTVEEAAAVLGISRWLAYQLVQRGELPIIRIGKRRVLVPRARIDAMLRGESVTHGPAQPVTGGAKTRGIPKKEKSHGQTHQRYGDRPGLFPASLA